MTRNKNLLFPHLPNLSGRLQNRGGVHRITLVTVRRKTIPAIQTCRHQISDTSTSQAFVAVVGFLSQTSQALDHGRRFPALLSIKRNEIKTELHIRCAAISIVQIRRSEEKARQIKRKRIVTEANHVLTISFQESFIRFVHSPRRATSASFNAQAKAVISSNYVRANASIL